MSQTFVGHFCLVVSSSIFLIFAVTQKRVGDTAIGESLNSIYEVCVSCYALTNGCGWLCPAGSCYTMICLWTLVKPWV